MYKNILLSFLTVLLLTLSYPSLDCGYLAWVALVPWFIALVWEKGRYVTVCSGIVGGVFFIGNLYWLYYVTPLGWVLLGLYCGGYFLAFGLVVRFIMRRLPLPLTAFVPFLWVTLEYLRSFILTGFPWLFIGHTQYSFLPIIQIADVTGVYGISFVVVLVNACVADIVLSFTLLKDSSKRDSYIYVICFTIVFVILSLSYGYFKLKGYRPVEGPQICVVQGNIPQSLKMDTSEAQQEKNLKKYFNLSKQAFGKDIDLLVWPETMVPGLLNISPALTGRKIDELSHELVKALAIQTGSNLLVGGTAIGLTEDEQRFYNSAFFYNNYGRLLRRYDKIHLVPFGEYTPLKSIFPFLARLVPYEISLSSGTDRTIFELDTVGGNKYKFGVVICYEDTVAPLVREFKKGGADFMLNITNDGWFRDSAELDLHLAIMVFRAVENRVGMVRAANTGISSFVSPDGKIYAELSRDNKRREIEGTLISRVMLYEKEGNTWYTSYGDVFAIFCTAISIIISGFCLWNTLRTSSDVT
ncbi:MAG: apolipoprotein N-acyltransferase [Candidatus Brocadiales bacterium]